MTFALTGLGPISNPQAWDVVYIGGVASPGVVKVSGFKRPHEWDIKKGKGVYGSVITYTGHPPARGTLTFELWTDSQIETEWPEFSALFQYDPTKAQVTGVGISYPSLNQIGITSVVCENIGAIEHKGAQLYEVAVDLIEWFPPPPTPAVSTPTTSTVSTNTTTTPAQTWEQIESGLILQRASTP